MRVVINRLGGRHRWRQPLWILLGILAYLITITLQAAVFVGPLPFVIVTVLVALGMGFMLISSPRERKGAAWLMISHSGIGLVKDPDQPGIDDLFWPRETLWDWRLKRVSPAWCQLQIRGTKHGHPDHPSHPGPRVFDGGSWIQIDQIDDVVNALDRAVSEPQVLPPNNGKKHEF